MVKMEFVQMLVDGDGKFVKKLVRMIHAGMPSTGKSTGTEAAEG